MLENRVARAGWTDHRFRGRALYGELLGRASWGGMVALALGRDDLGPEELSLLDAMCVCVCLADPHIWPQKLVRVAGCHGQPLAALCAGLAAGEGAGIGPWSAVPAGEWLLELDRAHRSGRPVGELVERELAAGRRLPGFGVPARRQDERVVALRGHAIARGRGARPWWRLWETVCEVTRERGLEPNIASAYATAAFDLGFELQQLGPLATMSLLPGFLANAVEGAAQRPALLRELPPEALRYVGPPRRSSERAR